MNLKKFTVKEFTVYGVRIFVNSLKEAKQKVLAAYEALTKHIWNGPRFIKLGRLTGVIYASYIDLKGDVIFRYVLFDPEKVESVSPHGHMRLVENGDYRSYDDAELFMRIDAAHRIFDFGTDDGLECIVDENHRRDHVKWCKWQRRYKEIKDTTGKEDGEIRQQLSEEGL